MITFPKLGRNGQFGNQLFQIASTIGIAKKNGYSYAFPNWINHQGSKIFFKERMQKYFVNPLPKLPRKFQTEQLIDIPWGFHELNIADNTGIDGYLQSYRYFEHCDDEVRHYLQMKKLVPDTLMKDTVAIHVRRGDYDGSFHLLLNEDYYKSAIEYFPSSYRFIVFSDDIEKSKAILGNDLIYVRSKTFINDFYLMSQCDHFITANSTFSWWAAFLSGNPNKEVIVPEIWFGPKGETTAPDSPVSWVKIKNDIES